MNNKVKRLQEGLTIISKEPGNSMLPIIRHRQPVELTPTTWDKVKVNDIVYCHVSGHYYTHKVYAVDPNKGCQIGNNRGHINGWTKKVYGKVTKIL